jgi:hypothetical protein
MPPRLACEGRRRAGLPRPPSCSSACGHHSPLLCRAHPRATHGSLLGSRQRHNLGRLLGQWPGYGARQVRGGRATSRGQQRGWTAPMVGQPDPRGSDEPHFGGRVPPPTIPSLPAAEEWQRWRRLRYPDAISSPAAGEPEEGPEWKALSEYAMVANDFRCPVARSISRANTWPSEPPLPSPVEAGRSWWVKEEHAYRARRGSDGLRCSRCGHLSPPHAPSQPLQMQPPPPPPPPPRRFEPRLASDDDGSSSDGDYEYMYYMPRYEYD